MFDLKLSTLSVILGLLVALPSAYGLIKPTAFAAALRQFPRQTPLGYVLMLLGTAWFLYNLSQESVSDFANIKKVFYILFTAVGIGACLFVQDYLPVRGLAVLFLLLAKLMVDTARWADTEWRLVIAAWAYALAIAGMWFTFSPWRLRDLINWSVATESRTRLTNGLRLVFGLFVLLLGLTVFKAVEKKPSAASLAPPAAFLLAANLK